MNDYLQALVFEFLQEQIDDEPIQARPDPFWSALKATGTEIWLDTGDMEEASKIWTAEMTALTTNNTLLNMEIQKGIYDDFIVRAKKVVGSLPPHEQVQEISFMLNARHGLRLVKRFGGFVSVELHTDTAYDIEAIVAYGKRFHQNTTREIYYKSSLYGRGLTGRKKAGGSRNSCEFYT
jgi:transaldolase